MTQMDGAALCTQKSGQLQSTLIQMECTVLSVKYNIDKDPLNQMSRLQVPRTPEDSPIQQDKWEDPPAQWGIRSNWESSWNDEHVPHDQYPTPDRRVASSEYDKLYPPSQGAQRRIDEIRNEYDRTRSSRGWTPDEEREKWTTSEQRSSDYDRRNPPDSEPTWEDGKYYPRNTDARASNWKSDNNEDQTSNSQSSNWRSGDQAWDKRDNRDGAWK
jgi:hypothetical protein